MDATLVCVQGQFSCCMRPYNSLTHRQAIRKQRERNEQVSELITALRDALARATQCRDLKGISGTTNAVLTLARTVAEGATLIDEYMKHSTAGDDLPLNSFVANGNLP